MITQQIDLTDRIERMPQMEEKWGVQLAGLYASATEEEAYDDDDEVVPSGQYEIVVNGEVEASSGTALEQSLDLVVTLHDEQGRVLAKTTAYLDKDDFFSLQAFSCTEYHLRVVPAKVRIYPQGS